MNKVLVSVFNQFGGSFELITALIALINSLGSIGLLRYV
jgi:hypothetical protein